MAFTNTGESEYAPATVTDRPLQNSPTEPEQATTKKAVLPEAVPQEAVPQEAVQQEASTSAVSQPATFSTIMPVPKQTVFGEKRRRATVSTELTASPYASDLAREKSMKSKKQTHNAKNKTKKKSVGKKTGKRIVRKKNLTCKAATARRTASAWFVASPMAIVCPERNG